MGKRNFNNSLTMFFTYCILAICVLICVFIPLTSSWLTAEDTTARTDGTTALPNPTLEFYNGTTALSSSHAFTTGSAGNTTALNIHVKNTTKAKESENQKAAAARVIVRVHYAIYVNTETKEIATTKHLSKVNYGPLALLHEHLPNTYSGYIFLDAAIEPETYLRLFTSVVPTEDGANKELTLELSGECILYEGNPYSTGQLDKLPWESYPAEWLNTLTWDTDFESYEDGLVVDFVNQASASRPGVKTVADAPVGNKVFTFTPLGYNLRMFRIQTVQQGYKYRLACYYKNSSVISKAILMELDTNGYKWDSYTSAQTMLANEWYYISTETDLLDKNPTLTTNIYMEVFSNLNETVWFDYFRLERIAGNETPI